MTSTAHRLRAGLLGAVGVTGLLAAAGASLATAAGEATRLGHRASVQPIDALPLVLWAALMCALLWAALLTAMATASLRRAERDPRGGDRWAPAPLVGRIAGLLLAVTSLGAVGTPDAVAGPAVPATAVQSTAVQKQAQQTAAPAIPTANETVTTEDSCPTDAPPVPGWVPAAPARTEQAARDSAGLVTGCGVPDDSGEVIVRRGDSLWSLVAHHLGPQADATAIAAEWPRWYAANRHLIGDDPDLLQVGTRLHAPSPALEGSPR